MKPLHATKKQKKNRLVSNSHGMLSLVKQETQATHLKIIHPLLKIILSLLMHVCGNRGPFGVTG